MARAARPARAPGSLDASGRCVRNGTEPCTHYVYGDNGRLSRITLPRVTTMCVLGTAADGSVAWRENGAGERTTYADDRG